MIQKEFNEKSVEDLASPFGDWPNDAGFEADFEEPSPVELVVTGLIPKIAAGVLYRAGPGSYKIKDNCGYEHKVSHWFDAFTQLHRFELIPTPDGSCKVMYNSRRQVDQLIDQVRLTGKISGITFGQKQDPCMSIFQKIKCIFEASFSNDPGVANVGISLYTDLSASPETSTKQVGQSFGGLSNPRSLTCSTDSTQGKQVDPQTLEPIGVTNQRQLHPELKGPLSCTHAQRDPVTGEVFNYNLDFGIRATYRVFKTHPGTGQTEILATITGSDINASYIHSFFLSEDFVILVIWPCLLAGGGTWVLWTRNMMDALKFHHDVPTKWYVVDRKHGRGVVAKFECEPFFAFHTINAYQKDRGDGNVDIMCDIIRFPNSDILHRFYYENLVSTGPGVEQFVGKGNVQPTFARYRLAEIPKDGWQKETSAAVSLASLELSIPGPAVGELPCIHPSYIFRETRYLYTLVDRGRSSFFDGIAKFDHQTKEVKYWDCEKHTPGEALFIPEPNGVEEDDGYLLSVVLNGETGTSYLLCLNAKDMTETGRADYDGAIGIGTHGVHFPVVDHKRKSE